MKVRERRQKWALTQLLAEHLPATTWDRPKHGFAAPIDRWLNGPLNDMMHDYLAADRLRAEGVVNVDFVNQLIADHERRVKDNQFYLWTLLMWEMWREHDRGLRTAACNPGG